MLRFFHPTAICGRSGRACFAGQTCQHPSSRWSGPSVRGKADGQYLESYFELHMSQKVCKVDIVMTRSPVIKSRLLSPHPEVSGPVAALNALSPSKSQWYFQPVAMVRVGKPPRTPARAVATSCRPNGGRGRYVERVAPKSAQSAICTTTRCAMPVPMSDDLAIPR